MLCACFNFFSNLQCFFYWVNVSEIMFARCVCRTGWSSFFDLLEIRTISDACKHYIKYYDLNEVYGFFLFEISIVARIYTYVEGEQLLGTSPCPLRIQNAPYAFGPTSRFVLAAVKEVVVRWCSPSWHFRQKDFNPLGRCRRNRILQVNHRGGEQLDRIIVVKLLDLAHLSRETITSKVTSSYRISTSGNFTDYLAGRNWR